MSKYTRRIQEVLSGFKGKSWLIGSASWCFDFKMITWKSNDLYSLVVMYNSQEQMLKNVANL